MSLSPIYSKRVMVKAHADLKVYLSFLYWRNLTSKRTGVESLTSSERPSCSSLFFYFFLVLSRLDQSAMYALEVMSILGVRVPFFCVPVYAHIPRVTAEQTLPQCGVNECSSYIEGNTIPVNDQQAGVGPNLL